MDLIQYEKIIVEKTVFHLQDPINGEDRWIRVEQNGNLDHWKPASKKGQPPQNLNGTMADSVQAELESKYQRKHGDED